MDALLSTDSQASTRGIPVLDLEEDEDEALMDEFLSDPASMAERFGEDEDSDDLLYNLVTEDGDEDYVPASAGEDDDNDLLHISSDEATEDGDFRKYPVFFSKEQRRTLLALYDGLEQGSDDDALLKQFHEASLALFTTAAKDHEHHRLHNPVEAFIITFNLRMDGSFRRPEGIAPNLSILQYWAQYSVLYNGIFAKGARQTVAQSVVGCVFSFDHAYSCLIFLTTTRTIQVA